MASETVTGCILILVGLVALALYAQLAWLALLLAVSLLVSFKLAQAASKRTRLTSGLGKY